MLQQAAAAILVPLDMKALSAVAAAELGRSAKGETSMASINFRLAMVVLALLCGPAAFRAADEKSTGADEEKRLLGEWAGTYLGDKPISVTFGPKNKVTLRAGGHVEEGTYTVDQTKKPAHLDLDWRPGRPGGKMLTILEFLDGDRIRIEDNYTGPIEDKRRPAKFSENSLVLKKVAKKK